MSSWTISATVITMSSSFDAIKSKKRKYVYVFGHRTDIKYRKRRKMHKSIIRLNKK